ncbi:serpin family protein [Thermococcus sp.]|uniref:serpin family protein n=1 Tax=Thermococcus sp. TaxID=35749 RepID=UPI00260FD352|nr:serpin family protein [Thermococcus sp.]
MREFYLGEVGEVDFVKDPNGAAREINGWVEERTNGRIRDIVSKPSGDTRLIITNAVYFRANWSSRFDGGTWNGTFHSPKGQVTVPMMHQTWKFPYFENDELQALELPYEGGRMGMLIILPGEGKFGEVEKELSTGFIWEILNGTTKESVKVTLPKFRLEETYRLRNALMDMGMEKAFTVPDFLGISPKGELAISDVIHKTFISVAENGTEAAAATAVILISASAPGEKPKYKVFNADHPFIFLIYDRENRRDTLHGQAGEPGGVSF